MGFYSFIIFIEFKRFYIFLEFLRFYIFIEFSQVFANIDSYIQQGKLQNDGF